MKWKRMNLFIMSAFLLASCTQAANNIASKDSFSSKAFNSTNSNKEIYKFAQEATNPKDCTEGDEYCHFKYLNQRSFSISKNDKNNNSNSIGGGYGTGWFLDREVGTNNFWIATNIHVGTSLTDAELRIKDFKQPDLVSLKIGKQDLLKENNNSRVDVLLDSNFKDVKFEPTYYDENNRLLLQSNTYSYTAPTPKNSDSTENKKDLNYFLNLKRLSNNYYFSKLLQLNAFGRIGDYTSETLLKPGIEYYNRQLLSFAKLLTAGRQESDPVNFTRDFFTSNKLMSVNHIWQAFYDSVKDHENGISSDSKLITDQNRIPFERLAGAEQSLLTKLFAPTVESRKTFIDGMIMKVTIDDETLARWFPQFLDPAKYNEWTFPRFQQTQGEFSISKSSDAVKNFGIKNEANPENTPVDKEVKYYRAGYPVEQVNGSLIYRSKGGPIFKTTVLSPVQLDFADPENSARYNAMDHLEVKDKSIDSSNNNAKIVSFDLLSKVTSGATREAGGGSSGSLVIDKDYNAVGIHWGSLPNLLQTVYTREPGLGIFTAFNVPKADQDVIRTRGLSQLKDTKDKNDNSYFRSIVMKTLFNNYALRTADAIWKKYSAYSEEDKKKKGINFDDKATIFSDLEKVFSDQETGHAETATTNSDDIKKKQAIVDAFWAKFSSNYASTSSTYYALFSLFSNNSLDYINRLDILNISVKGSGHLGYTDIRGQLTDFFKSRNIPTYNFNKIKAE